MPSRVHLVSERLQLEALASTARQELVAAMQACQPCTVKELAAHLGRPPESLYYHVRKLEQVGLVVEVDRRPSRRRPEAVYEAVARTLRIDPAARSRAALEARRKLGAGMLRRAQRLHHEALGNPDLVHTGRRREITLGQRTVRLSRAGLARVNLEIDALLEQAEKEQGRAGDLFTVTVTLAPSQTRRPD